MTNSVFNLEIKNLEFIENLKQNFTAIGIVWMFRFLFGRDDQGPEALRIYIIYVWKFPAVLGVMTINHIIVILK